jgi:hypothetical protein
MKNRGWKAPALSILLALASGSSGADGPTKSSSPPKKILVELYTSQGCSSCPPASDLVGRLAKLEYGTDRIVVLNFHVDYFNQPWVDPYSDPLGRRRQGYYNEVLRRSDLSFTPLMVVDGRDPLVGSNRSAMLASLARADREPAGVTLDLKLSGTGTRRSLSVRVAGQSRVVEGRELLVGVALAEDPVTTKVRSGENAGRTLVEHQVVRRFAQKSARLDRNSPQTLTFPVDLIDTGDAGRSRVSVFVQDRLNGVVYQADSIPWPPVEQARELPHKHQERRPKVGLGNAMTYFDLTSPILPIMPDGPPSCPDCGTPLSAEYLDSLPQGFNFANRYRFPNIPLPEC